MGHTPMLLKHQIMKIQLMRDVVEREDIVLTKYLRLDPALKTTPVEQQLFSHSAGKAKLVLLTANNDLDHKSGPFLSQKTQR
jgi:hypothetical protein